ncbi:hypothetical protein H5410_057996 [Solanum commersonii]|uniref:Uncharacterized protein n=1 Tax=Solanum commersonii TaxID=4109 RepID=A0A9J5WSE0_SOLCO|nr:hypothetical protein H5410_057996 [Solanum commersonii]
MLQIRNLIDVVVGLEIEDGKHLVQALKDDLLGILKGGDPVRILARIKRKDNQQKFNQLLQQLQGLIETATQLHINHARDYAPMMALIKDVKSIYQG